MKRLLALLLAVIIVSIFSIPAPALQAAPPRTTAYTKDRILLRIEPKPTARVIATLESNVRVRVNNCAEGWCSVTTHTHGLTGYVLEKFLVEKTSPPPVKR